jgi:transcriptional regulator with XRE-family HTH domain
VLVNLKSAIAARGLRQVDLALELKIAPSVLSEIVNGRRSAYASLRARLAEALQADELWLFSTITRIPPRDGAQVSATTCATEST